MKKKTERNQELFFAVADRVQFDPASYCQTVWGMSYEKGISGPECGTRGCIAGHALLLSGWELIDAQAFRKNGVYITSPDAIARHARNVLGLTVAETSVLFEGSWAPRSDLTVAEALRLVGKGEKVSEISNGMVTSHDLLREEAGRGT